MIFLRSSAGPSAPAGGRDGLLFLVRHSPTDELWNGVNDSRWQGSPEVTGGLRSAPGVSVVPGVPNRLLGNGSGRDQRSKPCGRRLLAFAYPSRMLASTPIPGHLENAGENERRFYRNQRVMARAGACNIPASQRNRPRPPRGRPDCLWVQLDAGAAHERLPLRYFGIDETREGAGIASHRLDPRSPNSGLQFRILPDLHQGRAERVANIGG